MTEDAKYVTVTTENFAAKVLNSDKPVLVDFWAEWCGPCRAIASTLEELAGEFDGRATVAKVNVDDEQDLAQRFGIRSIPALLFFRDGEVVDQAVGTQPKSVLAGKLESLLAAA